MKVLLILLNCLVFPAYGLILYRLKISLTTVILTCYIIFHHTCFLLLSYNPQGNIWDFVWPDYRFNYIFDLGNGNKPLYFLSLTNLFLFSGIATAFIFTKKLKKSHLHIDSYTYLLYAKILFVSCCLYMILYFIYSDNLPLFEYFKLGMQIPIRTVTLKWGFNQNNLWIFKSSIVRQVIQILLPLSSMIFYTQWNKSRSKESFHYFLISSFISFILIVSILKKTPILLYAVNIFLLLTCYKEMKSITYKKLLLPLLIGLFGLIGMSYFHKYTPIEIATYNNYMKNFSDKKSVKYLDFRTNKFSTNIPQSDIIIRKYYFNKEHYGSQKDKNTLSIILGRLFIVEGIASFVLVENDELKEYVRNFKPIQTYIKKVISRTKIKTIYEDLFNIMSGYIDLPGAITINGFLELYILLGNSSFILIFLIGFFMIRVDEYIRFNYKEQLIPFLCFIIPNLAQCLTKGLITGFFSGGLLISLLSFLGFYVSNKIVCKIDK